MKLLSLMRPWLASSRLPVVVTLLALVLALPALWSDRSIDDYLHHLMLNPTPPLDGYRVAPWDLFIFFDGSRADVQAKMEAGLVPWWTFEDIRIHFLRPLSSLSHALDYRLWPDHPALMHAHSLAWFGVLTLLAALLYRRFLGATWVAGLAALLYAIDDAHALPAAWLANRNSLMATTFSFLSILAYDRWRREGWRPGACLAPLSLLVGLLCGEMAVATGAFLLSHALFLEAGPLKDRLRPLIPSILVGVLWYAAYAAQGYGASGSGLYIDPGGRPDRFLGAVLERAPILVLAQLGFPPGDLYALLPPAVGRYFVLLGLLFTAATIALFAPLVRRSAEARFFALGAVLSLIPVSGTFPMDRLLFFVGFGLMGMLAQLFAQGLELPATPLASRGWQTLARVALPALFGLHLLLAPLLFPIRTQFMRTMGAVVERFAAMLPTDPSIEAQTLVLVNGPDGTFSGYLPLIQHFHGHRIPRRFHLLAEGTTEVTVHRTDAQTLELKMKGGLLQVPMAWLMRDPRDIIPIDHPIELEAMTIQVTGHTPDGRPDAARFRFKVPLEDASLRWIVWEGGKLVPFRLPAVGGSVVLPAQVPSIF